MTTNPPATLALCAGCHTLPARIASLPVPDEYVVTGGVVKHSPEGQRHPSLVSRVPVLIARIGADVETRAQTVTLTWPTGSGVRRWVTHTVPREVVASSRSIVGVASHGLPVDSTTAGELVRWIGWQLAQWDANEAAEPMTRRLGWHGGAFLFGSGEQADGAPHWLPQPTDGVDQYITGYRQRGTIEGQSAALWAILADAPGVRLGVAAAAAAPLLRWLDQPGFALELARSTGQGKTTAMRLAMALWGDPARLMLGWDATRVGIERIAEACHDLPVWIDDTKRARSSDDVDHVLYDLASGVGRVRGAVLGAQPVSRFRTVALTTGEASVTAESRSGGIRGRVLSWQGVVCPSAAHATSIDAAVALDHGYLGRALVAHIRTRSDAARARWSALRDWYVSQVPAGHPTGQRLAGYAASVAVAGEMLADTCGEVRACDWWLSPSTWAAMLAATSEASRAVAGLDEMLSHISATEAWYSAQGRVPAGGWAGSQRAGRPPLIVASWAKAWCERAGYSWAELLAGWRDRGWIGERSVSVRLGTGGVVRGWEILRGEEGDSEDPF
jgi:putative DNA primase/helicase